MDKRRLYAATYGHLAIDIISSSVAMILAVVSTDFGLSISQIGFGALLYTIFAAMSQPLFGGLTDRLRGRWVGPLGLLWTIIFYSVAAFMPNYPLFISCLMVGGLGSGAFHAAGLLNSTMSGGNRPTTATSIFFLGGQSGLAIGPIIAGVVLQQWGLHGMPLIAIVMLPAVVMMLLYMNDPLPEEEVRPRVQIDQSGDARRHGAAALVVVAFVLLITFRSGTSQTFITLLPKYYDTLGYTPTQFGLMLGFFSFAGAIGTFIGGYMGDRFNRRLLIASVSALSVPFSYLMLHTTGPAFYASAAMSGILLSIPHSIILVMAQQLAPRRRGLAGGLVLGFMFASGAAVAWIASLAADVVGLETVLSMVAFMPLLAGGCALLLPSTRASRPIVAQPQPSPAAD